MMIWLGYCGLFLLAFFGMEFMAWFTHRFIMHGFLWCWHRSHHSERHGPFEMNDLFAVLFAIPSIALILLGSLGHPAALAVGLGIAAYGAAYFLFHDGLVHRRFPVPFNRQRPFWRRRIQAHRLHHAVQTKHDGVSFGFLIVKPVHQLKRELSRKRHGNSGR
ncbi:beta-carotene 3-hydroxylase [Kushneria sinocarnis]|uniref:Beta-carotene 3-hydroxylase n=1 Tax=Kushneria sinocarnis TaxID=595502 RepID=A0A420WTH6_9GAMM|nr:sterol desaturase family protein [Kushneria sinocarnis]RKQ95845.1 beta-carotene 3-hydroxylase [Kushneria sinocarnis]